MRQSRSADEAARRLLGVIDCWKNLPVAASFIDGVIVQNSTSCFLLRERRQLASLSNCLLGEGVDRGDSFEQAQARLINQRHSPFGAFPKLDQSCAHRTVSKFSFIDCSLIVSPSPGKLSFKSMKPSCAL